MKKILTRKVLFEKSIYKTVKVEGYPLNLFFVKSLKKEEYEKILNDCNEPIEDITIGECDKNHYKHSDFYIIITKDKPWMMSGMFIEKSKCKILKNHI
jgi:hypothetical protein